MNTPKNIPINQIVSATLTGIQKSQKQYEKWSDGLWIWNAPEYFITVNVANELWNIKGAKYITLEYRSKETVEDAGARGRGKLPKDIREKGKVDILLWWGNETPRAVVEIKNYIYDYHKYENDIKRIKQFLKPRSGKSSLQFGLLGYCDSADTGKRKDATQKIEEKQLKIENKIKDILGKDYDVSVKNSKMYQDRESAWRATCIVIQCK